MKYCNRVQHYVPKSFLIILCPLGNESVIISTILYYNTQRHWR